MIEDNTIIFPSILRKNNNYFYLTIPYVIADLFNEGEEYSFQIDDQKLPGLIFVKRKKSAKKEYISKKVKIINRNDELLPFRLNEKYLIRFILIS